MAYQLQALWGKAGPVERAAYWIGAALIGSGLFHLLVFFVDGGPWNGPVSWRKAVTFALSFGLTLITIVWVAAYVRLGPRIRALLVGAFTVACVAETALITMQVWRGVPSHFNETTPLDTLVTRLLAVGGGVLVAVIAALTAASFRRDRAVAPSMRLAVRAGFVALDVAMMVGAVMIARGSAELVAGQQQQAYAVGGFLKPGHAATMHGILILPALAFLAAMTDWTERRRVRVVAVGTAGYAVFAAAVIAASLAVSLAGAAVVPLLAVGLLGGLTLAISGFTVLGALGRRVRRYRRAADPGEDRTDRSRGGARQAAYRGRVDGDFGRRGRYQRRTRHAGGRP
jgi:hypothetical protein